jgi:hypothetical protein
VRLFLIFKVVFIVPSIRKIGMVKTETYPHKQTIRINVKNVLEQKLRAPLEVVETNRILRFFLICPLFYSTLVSSFGVSQQQNRISRKQYKMSKRS